MKSISMLSLHFIWWSLMAALAYGSAVFGANSLNFANYNIAIANIICCGTTLIALIAMFCCYLAIMFKVGIYG